MIIGIGHRAYSGKDTVGRRFMKYGFNRRSFADPIYAAVSVIFGVPEEVLRDPAQKDNIDAFWGITHRVMLQVTATECMRNGFAQDVLIRSLKRHIVSSDRTNWVIPDVRFLDEAMAIKEWGGTLIEVVRPSLDTSSNSGVAGHVSETQLDDYRGWDHTIINDGTISDLHITVDALGKKLGAVYGL